MTDTKTKIWSFIKTHQLHYFSIYFILFYAVWALYRTFLYSSINEFGFVGDLVHALVKIVVWAVPVFLYIKCIDKKSPLSYTRINVNVGRGLLIGAGIGLLYIGVNILKAFFIMKKGISFDLNLDTILNVVIITGITEEIVFRGFLMNKIEAFVEFWGANVITAVLFVTIHFPIWIMEGKGISIMNIVTVFALGVLFGYTYKKTNSLWTSILLHATNNFVVSVIM